MKTLLLSILLIEGQNALPQDQLAQEFVVNHSKPYVYLTFDHIGSRNPVKDGEGETGLWLRVVNNCRIPIVFMSFAMPKGDPGVGLMDEVVDVEPMIQIFNSAEEEKEYDRHEELRKLKHKPAGYAFETGGIVRVQPGKDVLFSVPLNHVDDDWFMRVKFALDVGRSSVAVGPFTYLPFYEWDIPKEFRSSRSTHAAQKPSRPTENTTVYEP